METEDDCSSLEAVIVVVVTTGSPTAVIGIFKLFAIAVRSEIWRSEEESICDFDMPVMVIATLTPSGDEGMAVGLGVGGVSVNV